MHYQRNDAEQDHPCCVHLVSQTERHSYQRMVHYPLLHRRFRMFRDIALFRWLAVTFWALLSRPTTNYTNIVGESPAFEKLWPRTAK